MCFCHDYFASALISCFPFGVLHAVGTTKTPKRRLTHRLTARANEITSLISHPTQSLVRDPHQVYMTQVLKRLWGEPLKSVIFTARAWFDLLCQGGEGFWHAGCDGGSDIHMALTGTRSAPHELQARRWGGQTRSAASSLCTTFGLLRWPGLSIDLLLCKSFYPRLKLSLVKCSLTDLKQGFRW